MAAKLNERKTGGFSQRDCQLAFAAARQIGVVDQQHSARRKPRQRRDERIGRPLATVFLVGMGSIEIQQIDGLLERVEEPDPVTGQAANPRESVTDELGREPRGAAIDID